MRSQEEIVREIVKVIKKARPTAAVDETYIRDEIDSLRTPCDPSRNIGSKMRIMPRT